MDENILDKYDFIRLVANKADYKIKDTEVFFDAFLEALKDCVSNEVEANIFGFGRLYYIHLPERKGFKPISGKPGEGENKIYPPVTKVIFRLTKPLRDLIRIKSIKEREEEKHEPGVPAIEEV
jgi:nucleoid DNA-binding protein